MLGSPPVAMAILSIGEPDVLRDALKDAVRVDPGPAKNYTAKHKPTKANAPTEGTGRGRPPEGDTYLDDGYRGQPQPWLQVTSDLRPSTSALYFNLPTRNECKCVLQPEPRLKERSEARPKAQGGLVEPLHVDRFHAKRALDALADISSRWLGCRRELDDVSALKEITGHVGGCLTNRA